MLDPGDLRTRFDAELPKYRRATEALKQILSDLLADLSKPYGVRFGSVTGDAKTFESFLKKVATKAEDLDSVDDCFVRIGDLARARVVCHTSDDCYRMLKLLKDHQGVVYVDRASIDDKIAEPTETGYRAIHLQVGVDIPVAGKSINVACELQIRSALQEAWGDFTHADVYKGEAVPPLVASLMRNLSDMLQCADHQAGLLLAELLRLTDASESEASAPTTQTPDP